MYPLIVLLFSVFFPLPDFASSRWKYDPGGSNGTSSSSVPVFRASHDMYSFRLVMCDAVAVADDVADDVADEYDGIGDMIG
jgi:hypothetical protein